LGFCAETLSATAVTIIAADKYLNKKDFRSADMLLGL
jgi:primosomal protein N'